MKTRVKRKRAGKLKTVLTATALGLESLLFPFKAHPQPAKTTPNYYWVDSKDEWTESSPDFNGDREINWYSEDKSENE